MNAVYLASLRNVAGHGRLLDSEACSGTVQSGASASAQKAEAKAASAGQILLIDPKQLRRAWLTRSLTEWASDFACIAVASARELPSPAVDDRLPIRLVIISIGGADVTDAWVTDELALLRERFANLPIVVLADRDDASNVRAALQLGARGYLPTSVDPAVAGSALQLVLAGGAYAPPTALLSADHKDAAGCGEELLRPRQGSDARATLAAFTPRQREVLKLLGEGRPNKVIARQLGMCESTVKVHVRHIMRKLGARNRTQVALKLREITAADDSTSCEPRKACGIELVDQKNGVSNRMGRDSFMA